MSLTAEILMYLYFSIMGVIVFFMWRHKQRIGDIQRIKCSSCGEFVPGYFYDESTCQCLKCKHSKKTAGKNFAL